MNKIDLPFSMGIYGKSKSGKSHLIKYLANVLSPSFSFIIIISATSFSGDYGYLKLIPNIKYKIMNTTNLVEKLTVILKYQKKRKLEGTIKNILIVFDDIIGDLTRTKFLSNLSGCYRHYKLSLIFSYQVITRCDSEIRKNQSVVFIFKMKPKRELIACHESFLDHLTFKQMQDYFRKGFNQKYKFFFYNIDEDEYFFGNAPKDIYFA